jgi:hypothetical protein
MPASGAGLVVVVRLAALVPSSFGLPIRFRTASRTWRKRCVIDIGFPPLGIPRQRFVIVLGQGASLRPLTWPRWALRSS